MKKLLLILLLLTLCISAVACEASSVDTEGTDPLDIVETRVPVGTDELLETEGSAVPEHVILLSDALTTDQYTLTPDDTGCYLNFFDEYKATDEEKMACRSGEIYFDSLTDMVDSFRLNDFSKQDRVIMQAAFRQSEKGIEVCNLNRLYDATCPSETVVEKIALSGQYYDFCIAQEGMFEYGWVVYTHEESLQVSKDRMYIWFNGANTTVTRQETATFDGVPCEIVEYYNSTETYRDIYIEIEEDGKKTDMVLRYLLKDQRTSPERVSETAPWRVLIYCEDNGVFYKVSINHMLETPTYDWLTSFGLTPYVPSDSAVK